MRMYIYIYTSQINEITCLYHSGHMSKLSPSSLHLLEQHLVGTQNLLGE